MFRFLQAPLVATAVVSVCQHYRRPSFEKKTFSRFVIADEFRADTVFLWILRFDVLGFFLLRLHIYTTTIVVVPSVLVVVGQEKNEAFQTPPQNDFVQTPSS